MKKPKKHKPWAVAHPPASRKRHKGLKRPALSPEFKQYVRELEAVEGNLNAWASGEPQSVEARFSDWQMAADAIYQDVINLGFLKPRVTKSQHRFNFTRFVAMFDDVYDTVVKPRDSFDWKAFLKTIPDLKGQIIGNHTVVWGHKISFRKFTNPIYSQYNDLLSENAGMTALCECGWMEKDIIPLVSKPPRVPPGSGVYVGATRPQVDYALLEKVIMEHIQGIFEEVEYIVLPYEFFEDIPDGFRKALLHLLKASGAIMQYEVDTRSILIIDDHMPDEAIAELTEMFAGYEVGTRKVRVLRP